MTRKTKAAIFVVLTINRGGEAQVREALSLADGFVNAVSARAPESTLSPVISIGSLAWDRLFSGPRPKELRPFTALSGPVHAAPSTPADILLHIKADSLDLCFEVGKLLYDALGDAVTVVDEVHGFRYFDLRDLIGFVDGTENPVGQSAREAVTVGDEDPDFAGGSYVAIQRYVHDLDGWESLTVESQEAAIGRTKLSNVEMPDEVKPPNSHIALNVVEDADGNQIDIYRDNMPYGNASVGERGTFFIAYSSSPDVTEQMLRNMFLGDPPGTYDRMLDFTTAVTGAQFYSPTQDFFDNLPPLPGAIAEQHETATPIDIDNDPLDDIVTVPDGSLGIGSLRNPAN